MATAMDVTTEECPSEEEWDAEVAICMEDDEVYFVEDLTESEHPSTGGINIEEDEEEEEEWDAEGGFLTEVSNQDLIGEFEVLGCDTDEGLEALPNEKEDTKSEDIENVTYTLLRSHMR